MSSEIVLASDRLSQSLAIEKRHMIDTIKAQCFKGTHPDRISDTQLAAYIQVSQALMAQAPKFNPLLPGFLYAYPDKGGGITPIIGPDGVFALLSSNPDVEGWTTRFEKIDDELCCVATIKHKRLGEISKTCFLSEWVVRSNPNWESRPRHMLEVRALKHCARQCIHGIPLDADEFAIAKENRGFEHALPVTEAGDGGEAQAGEAPAAAVKVERPKRRTGVAAAVEPDPTQKAEPADVVLAAPKRAEKAAAPVAETKAEKAAPKAEEKPAADDGEQHAQEAAAQAEAALADPERAKKRALSDVTYPCTLTGEIVSSNPEAKNGKGLPICPVDFQAEDVEGVLKCYCLDVKNPLLVAQKGRRVTLALAPHPKNPAAVMVSKITEAEDDTLAGV